MAEFELQNWQYEGENYRVVFGDDGIFLELTDEEYLGDKGVYDEFTHYTTVIPYDSVSLRLCVVRTKRTDKATNLVFLDINVGNDAFDGDIEMPCTDGLLAAVDHYGLKLENRELLGETPPEKEKPRAVIRSGYSPLTAALWLTPPCILVLISGGFVLFDKSPLWPFLAATGIFVLAFALFFITYRPYEKLEFYENYIAFFRLCKPVTFIDKRVIELVETADDGDTIVVWSAAEYFEYDYSVNAWDRFKAELPGAEFRA